MSFDEPRKSDQWNPELRGTRGEESMAVAVLVLVLAGVAICLVACAIVILI